MKQVCKLFLLGLLVAVLASCGGVQPRITNIQILVDNTEKSESKIGQLSVTSLCDMLMGPDSAGCGTINWKKLNNVSLNQEKYLELTWEGGTPTRMQLIARKKAFTAQLTDVLPQFLGSSEGSPQSSIYRPVCTAIKELNATGANVKQLIILSDMIEYSNYGDFYHVTEKNVAETIKKLEVEGFVLPTAPANLKVTIVYSPKDSKEELKHNAAMIVWRKLFTEHGIPFEVRPNL